MLWSAKHNCQLCRVSKPYKDAHNRLLRSDKTCLYLAHHQLESIIMVVVTVIIYYYYCHYCNYVVVCL